MPGRLTDGVGHNGRSRDQQSHGCPIVLRPGAVRLHEISTQQVTGLRQERLERHLLGAVPLTNNLSLYARGRGQVVIWVPISSPWRVLAAVGHAAGRDQ
jgi:hypothetical protein